MDLLSVLLSVTTLFMVPVGGGIPVDVDRLSVAVALVETGDCRAGVGAQYNNCHGIRWKGEWKKFEHPEQSHSYFKWMWQNSQYYSGGFPTLEEAHLYTGSDNARRWLCGVTKYYYGLNMDCS